MCINYSKTISADLGQYVMLKMQHPNIMASVDYDVTISHDNDEARFIYKLILISNINFSLMNRHAIELEKEKNER